MAAMRTFASASLRPAREVLRFSRPVMLREQAERAGAQARILGLSKGRAARARRLAPILCSACQASDCVGLFGDWSAATAPAAVETSGSGAACVSRRWRDAVDAAHHLAVVVVAHGVAADAGVVPVGDEERAVGRDGDIGRRDTSCRWR